MCSKHLQLPNFTYLFVMARQPGAKNKTRIEMTLPSWYGEKLKELRVDSGLDLIRLSAGCSRTLCRSFVVSVSPAIKSLVTCASAWSKLFLPLGVINE